MKKLLFLLLFLPILTYANIGLKPNGFINDYTNLLTIEEFNTLNNLVEEYNKQTGIEIGVVIVPTLGDMDIDTYKNQLFHEWGVGKKGADNGLLIVIAPNEHKYGIETGYGLEPFMTDNLCSRFSNNNFPENFRAGKYFYGIYGFINDTMKQLGKMSWQDRLEMNKRAEDVKKKKTYESLMNFFMSILVLLFVGAVIFLFYKLYKINLNKKDLEEQKEKIKNNYVDLVRRTNIKLLFLGLTPIENDINIIENIKNCKDTHELGGVGSTLDMSFNKTNDIIRLNEQLRDNKSELKIIFDDFVRLKNKLGIENEYNDEPNTNFKGINERDVVLMEIEENIEQLEYYRKLSRDLYRFEEIKNKVLTNEYIDNKIIKNNESLKGKKYEPDQTVVDSFRNECYSRYDTFNQIDKMFSNLSILTESLSQCTTIENRLNSYYSDLYYKNEKYESMVNELKNSRIKLNRERSNIEGFLSNSDITTNNKKSIREVISKIDLFEPTDNIDDSYREYSDLITSISLVRKRANSDIYEEEQRRRRKREDEEYQERMRLQSQNSSYNSSYYSSYDSGYSSSSYDSGSSFGGGDSGGGGCSGSW